MISIKTWESVSEWEVGVAVAVDGGNQKTPQQIIANST
jgi:hypothetical protein